MNETIDQPRTRRDLATLGLDALDKQRAGEIAVSRTAGGVSFATALEVMEFAKLMSLAGAAVPKDFRANPGMCLAVAFQAVEWRMSPFQVANKAYVVNDRLGFESQLIHAVIEARADLQHRLECAYEGEGGDRVCIVTGEFTNGDVREYRSPKFKDINPKNSPLWKNDPDQQLWYFSSRAWARKWCPDVLMGIYTREELADNPRLGREEDDKVIEGVGLHQRLSGGGVSRAEGHNPTHIESELDQVAVRSREVDQQDGGEQEVDVPESGPLSIVCPNCNALAGRPCVSRGKDRPEPHKERVKRAAEIAGEAAARQRDDDHAEQNAPLEELPEPTKAADYVPYALRWLALATDVDQIKARWKSEMKLRNYLGITSEDRAEVEAKKNQRIEMLQ